MPAVHYSAARYLFRYFNSPVASLLLSSGLFASVLLQKIPAGLSAEKEDVFPLKRLHRAEVGGAFLETDGNRGHDFPDDI